VEHVFPNSFYIKTASGELVSVTRKRVRSPVSVNVEGEEPDFQSLLGVGSAVRTVDHLLVVGELEIRLSLETFSNVDLKRLISPARMLELPRFLFAAASLLQTFNLGESILDPRGMAYGAYESFFKEVFAPGELFGEGKFRTRALSLVGLGSGFTPSFDDFLSGFLCLYNLSTVLMGGEPMLFGLSSLQERTSWASSRLLDYMQHCEMDEDVEKVVASVLKGDGDGLLFAIQDVVGRGHSSGLDMSAGLLTASAVVLEGMGLPAVCEKVIHALGF
jgi:hypothetical protein